MYKVNPALYNGIFVVPSVLTDKYIKLSSETMLKAALLAFRHGDAPFNEELIAKESGISVEEIKDALAFWCSEGVLTDCERATDKASENKFEEASEPLPKEEEKLIKKHRSISPGRISYQQICKRLEESEEVRILFSMAQEKLGRTIGTADQSALLNLLDFYGLPVEVILALCYYATTHGKGSNINYIFSVGADWSNREILTLDDADREFKSMERIGVIWKDFCRVTGFSGKFPTTAQHKYLDIWVGEWGFGLDIISYAYEQMSLHTERVSFPYMNTILADWHSAGIKTAEQAAEYQKKRAAERAQKAAQKKKPAEKSSSPYGVKTSGEQAPASYDLDKATEQMNLTVPKYKKKEKR